MDIVITLAGHSRRFVDAGYTLPKFLIELDGAPVLEHVLDMFSHDDTFHFVINENQDAEVPNLASYLRSVRKNSHVNTIEPHELGPVHSARLASSVPAGSPIIISYCDFFVDWDYAHFLDSVAGYKSAIPAFSGVHPASFGNTNYAYMQVDADGHLIELREKQSFTSNRHEELASAGLYYFDQWSTFCNYSQKLDRVGFGNLREGYVSLLANLIIADGHLVKVTSVEKFICFGTPEDVAQYEFWRKYFRSSNKSSYTPLDRTKQKVNLIPMAGRGSRFKEKNIKTRKPFINVGKKPMLAKACQSLPQADRWVFIALEEDEKKYPIKPLAEMNLDGRVDVISVPEVTAGQAITCMAAKGLLQNDDEILISSCDYEVVYDRHLWDLFIDDPDVDACVWCVRSGSILHKDPNAFAYCVLGENGRDIIEIVEKQTISDTPQNDPLAIGVFWFRNYEDFRNMVNEAVEKRLTVNNEYYVATSMNLLIENGKRIKAFFADQWISFGDPFELQIYNYWEDYFWKRDAKRKR